MNTFNNIIIKCLLLIAYCSCLLLPNKTLGQPWTKLAGSSNGGETGEAIEVSNKGEVYVAGFFWSYSDFNDTIVSDTGKRIWFIIKYDSVGIFQWINTFRSSGNMGGLEMALDDSSNVYIGSAFDDTLFIENDTMGSSDPLLKHKPFVVKYNSNGVFQWVRTPEMNTVDGDFYAGDLKVSNGDLYFSGICDPTFFPWCDTLVFENDTVYGSFIVKYDAGGNVIWANGFGAQRIAFDKIGYYYTARRTLTQTRLSKYDVSDSLIWWMDVGGLLDDLGVDSAGNVYLSYNDFTINKYDSSGTLLWSVPYEAVESYGISTDNYGNVIVAYRFNNTGTYIKKYDSSGNYLGQIQLGRRVDSSASTPFVTGLHLDNLGFIYSTGSCSTTLPLIFGDDTLTGFGSADIFISKLSSDQLIDWVSEKAARSIEFYSYPNPFLEELTIFLKCNLYEMANIRIINYLGQEVYSENLRISKGVNVIKLDASAFPKGLYLLNMQTSKHQLIRSIIKL